MKTYSLEELTDKYIGKKGTKKRAEFENELRLDLLGQAIKQARRERKMTQEQLERIRVACVDKGCTDGAKRVRLGDEGIFE